jgi:nucleoside 2-deoxyribosyltransferase
MMPAGGSLPAGPWAGPGPWRGRGRGRAACEHESVPSRCYLASPLGFTDGGRYYSDSVLVPALDAVVTVVDPWRLTSEQEVRDARASGRERELALEIGRRNEEAIRSCELLVAYLEGQEPDSGTAAEVGYGAGLGLTCFGLRTDLRQSGEAGVAVNLQVEHFILASGGMICGSLTELTGRLQEQDGSARSVS